MSIDPITQQNLYLAIIGLLVAIAGVLQQVSAYLARKGNTQLQTSVDQHNKVVNNEVLPAISNVQQTVNGNTADLQKQITDLKAQLAQKEKMQ